MKINIKEFLKNRADENIGPKMSKKIIRNILKSFKDEGIDFCVLRNYNNIEKEKDVDLLVVENKKINRIMNKFGLRRRYSYGYFMSYKGRGLWFDFKVGCLSYYGFCFKDASTILKVKRSYKYFYILNKEDEFIHLLLHCILHKGYFKDKYRKRINYLFGIIDKEKVVDELEFKFSEYGKILFSLVEERKYNEALNLKKNLLRNLINFKDLPNYLMIKFIWVFWAKFRRLFFKNI
jgi:hypothetical protein